jgi:hypothetical protein
MTHTEQFDAALRDITDRRGSVYGHPVDDFAKVDLIKQAVADCPDAEIRHGLEMIGVKLARLAQTPDHTDSIIDIAGYARCLAMIVDEKRARDAFPQHEPTENEWIDWHGGGCPVPGETVVDVRLRDGGEYKNKRADGWHWYYGPDANGDIIAYRVVP